MNQYQYLESLEQKLSSLPYDKRRQIMYDYEEYFTEGTNEGKDEQILIESLGSPEKVALQYVTVLVPLEETEKTFTSKEDSSIATARRETVNPSPQINYAPQRTGNSSGTQLILALALGAFIFFIGFWLFFATYIVIFSFIIVGIALFASGIAVAVSSFVALPFVGLPTGITQSPVLVFLAGVILFSLGGLFLIAMFYVTKFAFYVTAKYIQWNIQVIRGY